MQLISYLCERLQSILRDILSFHSYFGHSPQNIFVSTKGRSIFVCPRIWMMITKCTLPMNRSFRHLASLSVHWIWKRMPIQCSTSVVSPFVAEATHRRTKTCVQFSLWYTCMHALPPVHIHVFGGRFHIQNGSTLAIQRLYECIHVSILGLLIFGSLNLNRMFHRVYTVWYAGICG